jgi:alpha-L-rhamnosidase
VKQSVRIVILLVAVLALASTLIVPNLFVAKKLSVSGLTVEYHDNPIGIDILQPRLGWVLDSRQRGQTQTAYRIFVATEQSLLKDGKADMWDSGKVNSNQTSQIVYAGKPLQSKNKYYWTVHVWDKNGNGFHAAAAYFVMGLLKKTDWQAKWIGFDGDTNLPLKSPYLRNNFTLNKKIKRAVVYASALGLYELYINGSRVGDDYFTPGWTDYNKRVYYRGYDVSSLLKKGQNAIGAILAEGWYAGGIAWCDTRENYGGKLRFIGQLEVEYADGTKQTIKTDESWQGTTGAVIQAEILMGQTCDARKEIAGWNTVNATTVDWQPVTAESQDRLLQAYPGSPVRKLAEIKAVNITEPNSGVFIFDMGQNFSGWARLKVVNANSGDKIVMRFAEMLNPDGTLYTKNLRRAKCTDTYICKGGAKGEIWEPQFTYRCFRYVEVTGYPGTPAMDAIVGVGANSYTPRAGTFECANPQVNKLYSNILWTQKANFFEIPTDCPQRDERLGWMGDAQVFCKTACYNMNTAAFFTKWLVDVDDAQAANGAFSIVSPQPPKCIAAPESSPAWSNAGIIVPYQIYQMYSDKQILEKHYPAMQRWMEYQQKNNPTLLLPEQGFGDWLNTNSNTPLDVLGTAYFANDARLMSEIAKVLGKDDDAEKYDELFRQIKEAFNKAYVSEDGRIKGDTQTCYILALQFNLLPKDKRSLAAKYLVEDIAKRDNHLSCGFIGLKDALPILTAAGYNNIAYKLLATDTFPSWLYPVKYGATTIWERWDGWTVEKGFQDPGMNSFAHYSLGAVGQWLYETVGGISSDGVGFKKIIIHPQPDKTIAWAKASYKSINGLITSSWKTENGRFMLDVVIPANTTAKVYIPAKNAGSVIEDGKSANMADGVKFLHHDANFAVFAVESGSYHFISE